MLFVIAFVLLGSANAPHVDDPSDPANLDHPAVIVMALASRIITGLAIGIICCSVSNYQTEICTKEVRGAIGTVFQIAIVLGLVMAYLLGLVLGKSSSRRNLLPMSNRPS